VFGRTDRKLSLKKETLRALTDTQLQTVVGGLALVACGTHHCAPPPISAACPTFKGCPVPATDTCPATPMTTVMR
jgi:hypothetical protein